MCLSLAYFIWHNVLKYSMILLMWNLKKKKAKLTEAEKRIVVARDWNSGDNGQKVQTFI